MSSFPVLSIITWAHFVGAFLIMLLARRSAALVRGLAVLSTSVSLVLSRGVELAEDPEAGGVQV
jgi:NADH:ubiquinone oxidoreductase subunit 4 (subunit M)